MISPCTVWSYIDLRADALRSENRRVTADNYGKAKRCLRRYCDDENLTFQDITEDFVKEFNAFLEKTRIQKATISFYNRVLRSIYNQAANDGLVKNAHPFDEVYTKVETKLVPISSKLSTSSGEIVNLDDYSKEELVSNYRNLLSKYNTLVNKLSAIVGV